MEYLIGMSDDKLINDSNSAFLEIILLIISVVEIPKVYSSVKTRLHSVKG